MSENEKSSIRDYKDLLVWQRFMDLAQQIYSLTQGFPNDGKFGLISQMRRAAVSVPSNIAEGQARNTTGEFIQFIAHAEGSLAEIDTQVRLANLLGFCSQPDLERISPRVTELQRMLKGLRKSLANTR